MKIEIGESLISSWLRHVKQCRIVQTNWKIASGWNKNTIETDANKALYDRIKHDPGLVGAFDPRSDRISPQGEINIIGVDDRNTVYFVISAFNAKDLQYGLPFEPQRSALEAKSHVCIKLWRSYLQSVACFSDKKYRVLFVLPEVKPLAETTINNAVTCLNKYFTAEQCRFYFCTNSNFKNDILIPTLKSTQNERETAEPFLQSCKLLDKFGLIRLPETNAPVFTPPQEPVSGAVSTHNTAPVAAAAQKTDTMQQRYVTIKGTRVETHPRPGESLQDFVKRTFSQLIENHLLNEVLFQKLFDRDFCSKTFGISYALLQTDWSNCSDNTGHARYWRDFRIAGTYFCCSQWGRQNFPRYEKKLAAWLESLADK